MEKLFETVLYSLWFGCWAALLGIGSISAILLVIGFFKHILLPAFISLLA